MSRYAPNYKGPMTTAGPVRPVNKAAPVGGPQPFLDAVSPRRPPVKPTPVIPTPVTPPKRGTGIPAYDDPKMADAYLENVARAGGFSQPPAGLTGANRPAGGTFINALLGDTNAGAPASVAPMMRKKKGGAVKKMAKGGAVKSSASKRADGIAKRGKTRGRVV